MHVSCRNSNARIFSFHLRQTQKNHRLKAQAKNSWKRQEFERERKRNTESDKFVSCNEAMKHHTIRIHNMNNSIQAAAAVTRRNKQWLMGLRSIKRGMITSADITASKFHCKECSFSLFCVTASGTLHSTFFYIIGENRTAQFSFTIIAISKAQLKATANVTNRKTMKFFSLAWATFPFQSTRHKQALGNAPEKFRDNFSVSARGFISGL